MQTIQMKKLILLFFFLWACLYVAVAQEFEPQEGGHIYPPSTMNKLKHIVDSLNLKFSTCDLRKVYLSQNQGIAHYVSVKGNFSEIKKDMENGIGFEAFEQKYKDIPITKNVIVISYKETDYREKTHAEFRGENLGYDNDNDDYFLSFEDTNILKQKVKGKWLYNACDNDSCWRKGLDAFYFLTEIEAKPLTEKYAKMVQYANCMVDTTAQIFLENASSERLFAYSILSEEKDNISKFMKLVEGKYKVKPPKYPDFPDDESPEKIKKYKKDVEKYHQTYNIWDSTRLAYLDKYVATTPKFKVLFDKALQQAVDSSFSNDAFERYVERYDSKEKALLLKRKRIVIGGCSQDQSPRYHALNIARLSAETTKWEIFLRSHLDIMNDRFQRVSDGSYAWAGRQTYIGELEALNINLNDLLLGICLRISNPSEHHYFGSIGRIGRALSETSNPEAIEEKMTEMMADNNLDMYNRIIIMYLFANYAFSTENNTKQELRKEKLQLAIQKLPQEIAKQINFRRE